MLEGARDVPRTNRLRIVATAAVFWIGMIAVSAYWNYVQVEKSITTLAVNEGRSAFNKDVVYRRWVAMGGGVYVPPSEQLPPNPYLAHLPNRDVVTTSGQPLTLVNPAYMTRQVYEMGREQYGLQGHITSLNPLRPENAPDPWEKEALKAFEKGVTEVVSRQTINGRPFMRLMRPLRTEEACLKCHGHQGNEVGSIRGGISVSVPLDPHLAEAERQRRLLLLAHGFIGVLGLFGLWVGNRLLSRAERRMSGARNFLDTLMETLPIPVFYKDREGWYRGCNRAFESFLGRSRQDIIGKGVFDLAPADLAAEYHERDRELFERAGTQIYETRVKDARETFHQVIFHKASLLDESGGVIGLIGAVMDVTEHRKAEETLRESHHRLGQIIEFLPDATFVIDRDGRLLAWNRAMEELTGIKASEILGKGDCEYALPFYGERIPMLIDLALSGDESYRDRHLAVTKRNDGVLISESYHPHLKGGIYLLGSASVLRDTEGVVRGAIENLRDITAIKEAEEELKAAREAAEQASRAKSLFLANMSHEIRTPMNGVIGMTALLLDTTLTPEQRRYAEMVKNSGEALLSLINDILDLSKIEAGKLEIENIDFDLYGLMDDFMAAQAVCAHEKGLRVIFGIDPEVPALLRGDPGRLRQILNNLVGNAVKFTAEGEVTVRVSLKSEANDQPIIRFEVRDTGIGISADRLETIFEKFTQADASTTRRFGGTGLGLAISKDLVGLMGGAIGVESEPGAGSCFWFTLPLLRQPGTERIPPPMPPDISGARVLVVDDHPANREILTSRLKAWGMRPEEAPGGREALRLMIRAHEEQDPFRIVLTDMQMPGMDGEAFCRKVQADPCLARIPLVLLTSLGIPGEVRRFREMGFSGYLTKPISHSDLLNTVRQALAGSDAVHGGLATHHLVREFKRLVRAEGAKLLLVEDNLINQEVALGLLQKLGLRADAAANGAEALDALRHSPYDLVLMDVEMPVMDGLEATRRIRALEAEAQRSRLKGKEGARGLSSSGFPLSAQSGRIPIVAMTAHAMRADREKCLEAGMDDYISKPVDPHSLVKVLSRWLTVKGSEKWMGDETEETEGGVPGREDGKEAANGKEQPPVFDREGSAS